MSQKSQYSNKPSILKTKMSTFYEEYQNGFNFMKEALEQKSQNTNHQLNQQPYDEEVYKALSSGVYEMKYDDQEEIFEGDEENEYHSQQINLKKLYNQSIQETLYESCRQKQQNELNEQQQYVMRQQDNIKQNEEQSKNQVQLTKLQPSQQINQNQNKMSQYQEISIDNQQTQDTHKQSPIIQQISYPTIQQSVIGQTQMSLNIKRQLAKNDQADSQIQPHQIQKTNQQQVNNISQAMQNSYNNKASCTSYEQLKPFSLMQKQKNIAQDYQLPVFGEYSEQLQRQQSQIKSNVFVQNQKIKISSSIKKQNIELIQVQQQNEKAKPINQQINPIKQLNLKSIPFNQTISKKESQKQNKIIESTKSKQLIVSNYDWRRLKWKGPRRKKREEQFNKSSKKAIITGYSKQYFLLLQTQVYDIQIRSKNLTYNIKRTYYNFNKLDELIQVYYKGYILNSFPQTNFEMFKTLKLSIGKQEDKIVLNEKRLFELQKYLNYLLNHQNIKSSIVLEIFLNSNQQFFKKQFINLQKITNQREKESQDNLIGEKYNQIKKVIKSGWNFFQQYIPNALNSHESSQYLLKIRIESMRNQQFYSSIKVKLQQLIRETSLLWQKIFRLKEIYKRNGDLSNIESNIDSVLVLSSKMSSSKSYYQWFCELIEDNILCQIRQKIQLLNQISQLINYRQNLNSRLAKITVENVKLGQKLLEKQNIFDQRFIHDWQKTKKQFQQDVKQLHHEIISIWKYYAKLMLKIWKDAN